MIRSCTLITLAMLAFSGSVFAADQAVAPKEAEYQCRRANNSYLSPACIASTKRASFYSRDALHQCSRITSSDELNRCVIGIRDSRFHAGALGQCARITSNEYLSSCVVGIANKRYLPEEIEACRRAGTNESLATCLIYGGSKL